MNIGIKKIESLRYFIIPAKMPKNCQFQSIHNQIFDFWNRSWTRTFKESGDPHGHWQDHFIRQDLVVALASSSEIAACHLYTFYNLAAAATKASEYFQYVKEPLQQNLIADRQLYTMTMEYLCVSPDWKINSAEVGLGKLMVSLGSNLAHERSAELALGMPISETKVDKMMENMSAVLLDSDIDKFGYKLKLMAIPTGQTPVGKDEKIKELTKTLWQSREDFSNMNTSSTGRKTA